MIPVADAWIAVLVQGQRGGPPSFACAVHDLAVPAGSILVRVLQGVIGVVIVTDVGIVAPSRAREWNWPK